jgi:hypothetical protein
MLPEGRHAKTIILKNAYKDRLISAKDDRRDVFAGQRITRRLVAAGATGWYLGYRYNYYYNKD